MMLVITRRAGEAVCIDNCNVKLIVQKVGDRRVRLVFDAPQDVSIRRAELPPRAEEVSE